MTTTDDLVDSTDGETSLREAFTQASKDNADSTIVVSSGSTYQLTRCDLGQLMHSSARTLRVVMTDNRADGTGGPVRGGAVFAQGTTTITDSHFLGKYSNRDGGAVFSSGPLTISGGGFYGSSVPPSPTTLPLPAVARTWISLRQTARR